MTEPNVKDEDRELARKVMDTYEHGRDNRPSFEEHIAVEFARLRERAERAEGAARDWQDIAENESWPYEWQAASALKDERDEQAARAETLRAALEAYMVSAGDLPGGRRVRVCGMCGVVDIKANGHAPDCALSTTPAASLAALRLRDAERVRQSAIVIAHGACRTGEKCQDDGGCRHVPCITARMIVADLQRIDLSALLGIAPPAAQKGETR